MGGREKGDVLIDRVKQEPGRNPNRTPPLTAYELTAYELTAYELTAYELTAIEH